MFGSRRAIVFDPYRGRRKRRLPAWLLMLLLGIALGITAVITVQQKLLPPRLSVAESQHLRESSERIDADHRRLEQARIALAGQLDKANAEARVRDSALNAAQDAARQARTDLAALLVILPPDPRAA